MLAEAVPRLPGGRHALEVGILGGNVHVDEHEDEHEGAHEDEEDMNSILGAVDSRRGVEEALLLDLEASSPADSSPADTQEEDNGDVDEDRHMVVARRLEERWAMGLRRGVHE
jgi:hypothetical protein